MKHFAILRITLASIVLVQSFCFGCMELGTPHQEEIVHGYYTSSSINHVAVCKKEGLFSCPYLIYSVQDIDYNEKFIVVKSIEYPRHSSTEVFTWYIIDAINGQTYGPFSYNEYIQERLRLSVPDTIERLKPEQTEFEAYQRKHSQASKDKTTSWLSYMPYIGGALAVVVFSVALRVWIENRKHSL
jgi:hypothetical protein